MSDINKETKKTKKEIKPTKLSVIFTGEIFRPQSAKINITPELREVVKEEIILSNLTDNVSTRLKIVCKHLVEEKLKSLGIEDFNLNLSRCRKEVDGFCIPYTLKIGLNITKSETENLQSGLKKEEEAFFERLPKLVKTSFCDHKQERALEDIPFAYDMNSLLGYICQEEIRSSKLSHFNNRENYFKFKEGMILKLANVNEIKDLKNHPLKFDPSCELEDVVADLTDYCNDYFDSLKDQSEALIAHNYSKNFFKKINRLTNKEKELVLALTLTNLSVNVVI